MQVMVTGSNGKIGQAAVCALRAAGHRVTGIDLGAKVGNGIRTAAVDCSDFGELLGALSGIDTMARPDARIFDINTRSTYNVFSACARLGIDRVVWGSSETILGLPFTAPPAFLPIDEQHLDTPNWSYSLSKFLGEQMADQMVRWHPTLTIASLRFSNVFDASDYAQQPGVAARPGARRMNLWGYVDVRDAGEACRLAVEADLTGHHRMIIAAADNLAGLPSAGLVAEHFPDVPVTAPLIGTQSLLSSARAAALIGYRPRYGWNQRE